MTPDLGPLFSQPEPKPEPRLKPQAVAILHVMREGRGITKREAAELGCWNLPGRIFEIREVYGAGYVVTEREPNGNGGTHARYKVVR